VTAIKEGQVKIAPIEVVYSDAKNKIRSNRSDPSEVIILPPRKPEIDIRIDPIPPINPGGSSFVNVTIENNGQAAATLVDVKLEGRPDGLEIATPTTSYDRILPGSKETFSTEVKGNRGGNFTVIAEARYKVGSEAETKKAMGTAAVLEQEYKYLYYLLIIPVLIIGFWIYRRYREYKY
jgi:hypothetical protein